jgi:hypothetical protein
VELALKKGGVVLVGSQRPDELVRALEQQLANPRS